VTFRRECQVTCRREIKKGGVANRPSPQSPKGILGSPPHLYKKCKAQANPKPFIFNELLNEF